MKFLIALLILVPLCLYGLYAGGAFSTPDPQVLYDEIMTKATPGMDWQDVADIREPRKFRIVVPANPTGTSGQNKFERQKISTGLTNDSYPSGFVFDYQFSDAHACQVFFSSSGKVTEVAKMVTFKDLLNGNIGQP